MVFLEVMRAAVQGITCARPHGRACECGHAHGNVLRCRAAAPVVRHKGEVFRMRDVQIGGVFVEGIGVFAGGAVNLYGAVFALQRLEFVVAILKIERVVPGSDFAVRIGGDCLILIHIGDGHFARGHGIAARIAVDIKAVVPGGNDRRVIGAFNGDDELPLCAGAKRAGLGALPGGDADFEALGQRLLRSKLLDFVVLISGQGVGV